ncbi:hypothetical protein KY289_019543 [Solanum tuberosum]|nr:hypothetical protein KY289_019543 [Solanum tuberosum]
MGMESLAEAGVWLTTTSGCCTFPLPASFPLRRSEPRTLDSGLGLLQASPPLSHLRIELVLANSFSTKSGEIGLVLEHGSRRKCAPQVHWEGLKWNSWMGWVHGRWVWSGIVPRISR